MPSVLTYPGVYIEEVPSGVRTISGVGTSITAFVGYTAKGPLNSAVRLLSFAEFERAFGGLSRDSEVSYAVQQYFLNGGSDAYVVRVANGAATASVGMNYVAANGTTGLALTATAASPGAWGNNLRLDVDYGTTNPDSTFNLTVTRIDPATLTPSATEQFLNLGMDDRLPSFAPSVVNAGSQLIRLEAAAIGAWDAGYSISKDVSGGVTVDATHNKLTGKLNGTRGFELTLDPAGSYTNAGTIATSINNAIGLAGVLGLTAVRVKDDGTASGTGKYVALQSQPIPGDPSSAARSSAVTITPAPANDASALLGFGVAGGGREFTGSSFRRPEATGTLSGDLYTAIGSSVGEDLTFTITNNLPSGAVSLLAATTVTVPSTAVGPDLATAIQAAINAETDPVAKRVQVAWTGRALRVTLPDSPYATIVVAESLGTKPLKFPAAGAASNVQRYTVGQVLAPAAGAQVSGTTGADGTPPLGTDYIGSEAAKTGMYALLDTDLFTLMAIPGAAGLAAGADDVIQTAIALCERRRAFYIIDPPAGQTLQTVGAWAASLTTSANAAVYWPRIVAADPLDGFRPRELAASGAVAGVYARTDSERGIWKAPAGTDATIRGTQALAYNLTDLECGLLNPFGVNCLRSFPVYGRVVWGARTRSGADALADEYKYVPVRRLASYIEESLYRGTQWVVFEPNDEPLWAQIRLNVGAFMNNLFRQGAFQGKSPAQAYLVKCDSDTTTQNDIDLGVVNILVAFAPLKPAEFVVIRLQQKAGQVAA
jgi:phage tail sheath protein FI